ncbi:MAG TPA: hypothetical protein VHY20_04045, partial [Pirellulales bacterium]|nr:hypothetical protein [Pirellulales bacterium]
MSRRLLGTALLSLLTLGCGQGLETKYGVRTGVAAESVNGTSVLAEMFKQAGHAVSGATWAGPHLADNADVIVWFPDSLEAPASRQRRWFEDWLCQEPGRTLVYVGRDYDAAPAYWKHALELATLIQEEPVRRRLRKAEVRFDFERLAIPERENCGWFTILGKLQHRAVHELSGDRGWVAGVDPKGVEIELNGRVLPGKSAHALLVSKRDTLVSEKKFCSSKLLLVANGSFLLNFPLVNHEHRKLAGKLIDSIGSNRRVTFLESGPQQLDIYDTEPENAGRSGLAILAT